MPSDKSSDFWKNLSNFPNVASTVLRAWDLELHFSLCLLWSVSAGSGWEEQHSWHRCEWPAHVHTVLPRTNRLPASPLFEIKLFNLTVFSPTFFFYLMHLYYSLSQSFSSFQFPNSSKIAYGNVWETVRDCAYSYTTINLIKLIKLIYTYKKQNPELYHCRWCNCWFYKFSSVVWQKICNVKW